MIVYGIYSGDSKGKFQRLYYVIESSNDSGFTVIAEDECDIIDNSLDHYFMRKDGRNMDILIHKAAYTSEDFFDSLVDHDDGNELIKELYENMSGLELTP